MALRLAVFCALALTSQSAFAQPAGDLPNVGYVAPALGTRQLSAGSSDRVSALSYGGVDDTGASDSTAGLNAGIADSAARAKALVFPCGTYLVDNLIITSGARLYPERRGCVTWRRKADASNSYVASAAAANGFVIDGITIDGNAAANAGNPGSGLHIVGSSGFSVRDLRVSGTTATSSTFGVGIQIDDCLDVSQGRGSDVSGSTFIGDGTTNSLSGLLVQRCGNLEITRNKASGHTYAGIAIVDQALPVSASPTNVNILVADNDTYQNGVGIYITGFSRGPGIGGVPIASYTSFVNKGVTLANNRMHDNTVYGCVIAASGLTMSGNTIRRNGTGMVYGGCSINATLFSATGNVATENSYYGLDFGGSSYGILTGNTIRQNGKLTGKAVALNLGATIGLIVGQNDVGDNGGPQGGAEVLGSALDGSGTAQYFPWVGTGLTIDGLSIEITNPAMAGLRLTNGWTNVAIPRLTIRNRAGSQHPFDIHVAGSTLKIGEIDVLEPTGAWHPSVASAASIVIPDYAASVDITGTATISTIMGTAQSALKGGLREFVPSSTGQNYSASVKALCTATGGTAATVEPARAPDGKIYGFYVISPGGGASAMTCIATDQACTATAGAVTVTGGVVTAVASGAAGKGCASPPAVLLSGLTCATTPVVHANVAAGSVSSFTVDYGGSGCTGAATATVANGSGLAGTAHLGAGQADRLVRLNFLSTATVAVGGNFYSRSGKFVGDALGIGVLNLKANFGNFYDAGRN